STPRWTACARCCGGLPTEHTSGLPAQFTFCYRVAARGLLGSLEGISARPAHSSTPVSHACSAAAAGNPVSYIRHPDTPASSTIREDEAARVGPVGACRLVGHV